MSGRPGMDHPIYVYGLLAEDAALAATTGATTGADWGRDRANDDRAQDDRGKDWGQRWAEILGVGVGGAAVRLLPAGPLTALTSAVPQGPVAQTRRNMVAHTAVLERAMTLTTVLPMRFGTLAPSPAAVRGCLAANAPEFQGALRAIAGRVELGVKARWHDGVVFADIIAADPALGRLRDRLRDRPARETYYERLELGRRVEAALAGRRAVEAAAILAELTPLAEREAELRTLDEDMILNRAFLVKREHEARFDERLQAVAERHAARMSFRYVGPVPPYNFVHLRADWLSRAA